jgi:hypothetical protein
MSLSCLPWLASQTFDAMLLVGGDFAGKQQAWVEIWRSISRRSLSFSASKSCSIRCKIAGSSGKVSLGMLQ